MTLPLTHVAPDELYPTVLAIRDQLRSHADYIGCASEAILDYPTDPVPGGQPAAIEVFGISETEEFGVHGAPSAPDAEATVLVVVKVDTSVPWQATLLTMRARVRSVLLQDPDFTRLCRFRRLETEPLSDRDGQFAPGSLVMRLITLPYMTEYPPAGLGDLTGVDIDASVGTESHVKMIINLEEQV